MGILPDGSGWIGWIEVDESDPIPVVRVGRARVREINGKRQWDMERVQMIEVWSPETVRYHLGNALFQTVVELGTAEHAQRAFTQQMVLV